MNCVFFEKNNYYFFKKNNSKIVEAYNALLINGGDPNRCIEKLGRRKKNTNFTFKTFTKLKILKIKINVVFCRANGREI